MKIVGLIPARGGSKRIPGKNGRSIAGKPLLSWTCEAAQASPSLTKTYVLSDSQELIDIARKAGVEAPYIRGEVSSGDQASSVDVIREFFDRVPGARSEFTHFMYLQPTSPLRGASEIERAIVQLKARSADSLISVVESPFPPSWINQIPQDGSMGGFLAKSQQTLQSQQHGKFYRLNGAIFLASIERYLRENSWYFPDRCFAFEMSAETSVDIDTESEWRFAEMLLLER